MINKEMRASRDAAKGTYKFLRQNVDIRYLDQIKALVKQCIEIGKDYENMTEEEREIFFQNMQPFEYVTQIVIKREN